MDQSDDEETLSFNHNRICCSLNNSMAISNSGDIFVWGKTNQGLFNAPQKTSYKAYPAKLSIPKLYPFYKAVHVSMGLSHATAVLECQLSKMFKDSKGPTKEDEKELLNQLRSSIWNNHQINLLEEMSTRYITQTQFTDILKKYNQNFQTEQKDQLNEDSFRSHFAKDRETIDFLLFFHQINKPKRAKYRTIVWGKGTHGRLGIGLEQAKKNKMNIKLIGDDEVVVNNDEKKEDKAADDSSGQQEEVSEQKSGISQDQFQQSKSKSKNKDEISFVVQISELQLPDKRIFFAKLSCGHHHTIGLTEDNKLFSWGMGSQGCLGTGQITDLLEPTRIYVNEMKSSTSIRDICCGAFHCLVLTTQFEIYSWGVNSRGQLGIGNTKMQLSPIEVTYFSRKQIQPYVLAAGDQHSAALTKDHELFTWGNGDYYRLGHGICMDEQEPKKVEVLQDVYVESVACGTNHTLCITNEGFVYSWGSGMNGKLDQILPTRCGIDSQSFRDHAFYQVAAGTLHSMALSSSGHLFTWGSSKNGLLGVMLNRGIEYIAVPQRVDQGQETTSQKFFKASFFKIMEEHEAKFNKVQHLSIYQNALSYGAVNQQILELKLKSHPPPRDKDHCLFRYIVCGENNTFFITKEGKLYGCGSIQNGLLMRNPEQNYKFQFASPSDEQNQFAEILKQATFQPIELNYFSKTTVNFISCSYNHAIAITRKGSAFCWGQNQNFQLGLGFSSNYIITPIKLMGALEQKKIVMACTGQKFSGVLTDQGEVWTFGTSDSGVLGHEKKNYYIVQEPRMINDIPAMSYIASSSQSMMAIQDFKQRVWVWGNNQYGQLGISLVRPDIIGALDLNEEEDIKMDETEKKDKETLKKEKKNLEKQIDHMKNPENYILYKPIANPIKASMNEVCINQIACGAFHSLALATDGVLYAAGLDRYAGLSRKKENNEAEEEEAQEEEKDFNEKLRRYIDHFTPLPELEGRRIICISTHEHHSLALTKEFEIYGWGAVKSGKLTSQCNVANTKKKFEVQVQDTILPTKLSMPTKETKQFALGTKHQVEQYKWIYVSCGSNHSIALSADSFLFSWGSFIGGRLGVSLKTILDRVSKQESESDKRALRKEIEDKYMSIPNEVKCYLCEEKALNNMDDNSNDEPKISVMNKSSAKSDTRSKTSTKKSTKDKGDKESQKKKAEADMEGDFSFEDEEILNESSLCSEAPSEENNMDDDDYFNVFTRIKKDETKLVAEIEEVDEEEMDEEAQLERENQKFLQRTKIIKQQQDPLQKNLMKQTEDCEAENLYAQDYEIETKIKILYQDVAENSLQMLTKYLIINSRIQEIMDHRCKKLAQLYQSEEILDLKFSVPLFIIKNIQLYEGILSFIYYHPCYILKIVESQQLNKSQIIRFLDIIYRNKLMQLPIQAIIMSIAIHTFEIEFKNCPNKMEFITELKAFKSSSIFTSIYIMLLRSIDREYNYFKETAKFLLIDKFFKIQHEQLNLEIQKGVIDQKHLSLKMQHFLNLHYEQSNFKELEKKLNCMGFIVSQYIQKIIKERENAKTNNDRLISIELLYLHNEMIRIISQGLMSAENARIQQEYGADSADYQEKAIEKLRKFEAMLWPKVHNFLIHLYYTSITDFLLELSSREIDFSEEYLPFLKGGQNVKMTAQIIDRFFQKDPFLQNSENYARINKLINDRIDFTDEKMFSQAAQDELAPQKKEVDLDESEIEEKVQKINDSQNLNRIKDNASFLYDQVFFNVENLNLKEIVIRCYEVEDKHIQMEIQDVLFLQNFYCSQINRHQNISSLFVRGIEDPIFIILKHLDFREIDSKNFSTEILKRKINFKLNLHPIIQILKVDHNRENVILYKCDQCGILLTKNLLSKRKEQSIDKLIKDGWICKRMHKNSIHVLDCEDMGCNEMIPKYALKNLRLLNYFQREKDAKTELLAKIMKEVDVIKKGEDFHEFLQQVQKTNRVKKNQVLVEAINSFIELLLSQKRGQENAQQMTKTSEEQQMELHLRFQINYESVYSQTFKEMQVRQRHRKQQMTYVEVFQFLDNIINEKVMHVQHILNNLIEAQYQLKQRMKIMNEDEAEKNVENLDDDDDDDNFMGKRFLAFGFYTSANMIQNGSLVKITFQGKHLSKIAKNIKFYFYGQSDGGFFIHLIYLQDSLLNNLVRCVKQIYPNELSLFKITISIDQYLELKRMAKYRTQITFKKDNMEVTFNILKLVQLLKYLDQRIVN